MKPGSSNAEYLNLLNILKERIKQARLKAALSVNAHLLAVYWEIGKTILAQQKKEGWGTKIIDRLAADLKTEFPDMKGISVRNLKYMRTFAEAYPDFLQQPKAIKRGKKEKPIVQGPLAQLDPNTNLPIVQGKLAQITWYHHITILDKVKSSAERLFYIEKTVEHGWSRDIMVLQIENKLYQRQGKAITNFERTLPATESDLARETFKSPYMFDFITLSDEAKEKDVERALIQHLKKFMLELGRGFAYVGNQYNLNVAGDDYFLDLLFYNVHLHCYVIFELKLGEFKPEYAGKLNFYINTVNEQLKGKEDKPTIGVLLCKTPNETVVKFSLQGIDKPMGIADYKLANSLPKDLKGEMPTIAELETEMEKNYEELQTPVDKKLNRIKDLISQLKYSKVEEKKNEKNCSAIFNKVVLPLKHQLEKSLVEVTKEFKEIEWMVWIDGQGYTTERNAIKDLKEKKIAGEFRIEVRMKGFKKAGVKAFNIWCNMVFELQEFCYRIGKDKRVDTIMIEKVYHILPNTKEMKEIEEIFKEAVYDEITNNLERIKSS